MAGKGCISLVRADKILTRIAHVGAASFTMIRAGSPCLLDKVRNARARGILVNIMQ